MTVSEAAEDAAEDDILVPLQSSHSPQSSAHHRASRKPASEDAMQVTSPIREKTDLEGMLAHARSAEGALAVTGAEVSDSVLEAPAAGQVTSGANKAEASSPSAEMAVAEVQKLLSEIHEPTVFCQSDPEAAVSGAVASNTDAQNSKQQSMEAAPLESITVDDAEAASHPEALAEQAQQLPEVFPSPEATEDSLTDGAVPGPIGSQDSDSADAPVTETALDEAAGTDAYAVAVSASPSTPVHEQAQKEAAGTADKEVQPVTPIPDAVAPVAETHNDDACEPAAQEAEDLVPEESQVPTGSEEEQGVAVSEVRVRCSTPFYGPDSPGRALDGLDSPLLQATLEEPSPAHISLQGQSEAFAKTPTTGDIQTCGAAEAVEMHKSAGSASAAGSIPQASATIPALTLAAIMSPETVPHAVHYGSSGASDAVSGTPIAGSTAAQASPAVLTVDVQVSAESSTGAFTPEPSPSAERLVSERSLDEAEFVLLQEVMSKPLNPADQVPPWPDACTCVCLIDFVLNMQRACMM